MSTSINIPDLLTTIYVLVDDWYRAYGAALLKGKPGAKPDLSDSEMMTLMLAQDLFPYPGETQFVGFMRANYPSLFPRLVDQSQFNRRARGVRMATRRAPPDRHQPDSPGHGREPGQLQKLDHHARRPDVLLRSVSGGCLRGRHADGDDPAGPVERYSGGSV